MLRMSPRVEDECRSCCAPRASATDAGHISRKPTPAAVDWSPGKSPAFDNPSQNHAPMRATSQPRRVRNQTPESRASVHPRDRDLIVWALAYLHIRIQAATS